MGLLSFLSLAVSFLFFLLSFLSLTYGPKSRVLKLFSLLTLSIAIWALFYSFVYSADEKETAWKFWKLSSFGWVTFCAFSLHFSLEFVGLKRNYLIPLIYIPTSAFLFKALEGNLTVKDFYLSSLGWAEIPNKESTWYPLFVIYYMLYVSLTLYLLWRKRKSTRSLKEAKQISLLLGPALLSIILGSFSNVLFPLSGIYFPAVAPIFSSIFALGALSAIFTHRLFNVTPSLAVDQLLHLIDEYFFLLDLDWRITHVNRKAKQDLGYSEDEILSKHPFFIPLFENDPLPSKELETEIVTKNGESIPVQVFLEEIRDRSGEITGYALIARDLRERKRLEEEIEVRKRVEDALFMAHELLESKVKERTKELEMANEALKSEIEEKKRVEQFLKHSEEKYRLLFENAADAICTLDSNLTITSLNRRALDLFGYDVTEILGKDIFETGLIHEDSRTGVYKSLSALAREKGITQGEIKVVKKNGEVLECEVTSASYYDRMKEELAIVSILRDVTEKKRIQEELLNAKKQESLAVLAKGIAHDFNNLLAVVMGNISLAKLSPRDEKKLIKRLEDAENAIIRTKELVSKILNFAEKKTGKKTLVSMEKILKEQVALVLSGTSIRCEYDLPQEIPMVYGDEEQLSQVINGIIWNAREAMSGKGVLSVKMDTVSLPSKNRYSLEKGEYLRLTIKDTGIGIKEEHLSRVFEPYFSTKEMGARKGVGLSLALAYTFIKNHGGHIEIESQWGLGTSVYIYLPVSGTSSGRNGKDLSTGKVLVMEDEPSLRELIGEILLNYGFEATCVSKGEEAIKSYKESLEAGNGFDVVLLDLIVRDGMGAEETIDALKKIDPNVKAVVMSGYVHDPSTFDFRRLGFRAFVSKPFDVESLISLLEDLAREKNISTPS